MGKRRNPSYLRNFTVTLKGKIGELDFFTELPDIDMPYFDPEFLESNFVHNYACIAAGLNEFDGEVFGRIVAHATIGRGVTYDKILPYADMYHSRSGYEFLRVTAICVIFAEMLNIHREKHSSR